MVLDEFGNQRPGGVDSVELAELTPEEGKGQLLLPAADAGAGTYIASLTVKAAGIYRLCPKVPLNPK